MQYDLVEFTVANVNVMARPVEWDNDVPTLYHTTCPSCGALQEIKPNFISVKCSSCRKGNEKTKDGYASPLKPLPKTRHLL